jgi:hypothetical protein
MSIELLRVEFRVVALERDDSGVPVAEHELAQGVAYPGRLDELPDSIRSYVEQATEQLAEKSTQDVQAEATGRK